MERKTFTWRCWTIFCLAPFDAAASSLDAGIVKFVFNGTAALAVLVGALCIWLGYKLFTKGIEKGKGQLDFQSKAFSLVFSGVGPGLFFMAFGALIALAAVITSIMVTVS